MVQTQGLEWDFLYQSTDQYIEDCSDHANLIFLSRKSNAKETKPTKHSHTRLAVILSFTSFSNRKEQFLVLSIEFHVHWITRQLTGKNINSVLATVKYWQLKEE